MLSSGQTPAWMYPLVPIASLRPVHDHVHYMWLRSIEQTECAFYSYHFMHTVPGHVQWWMGGGGGGGGGGGLREM